MDGVARVVPENVSLQDIIKERRTGRKLKAEQKRQMDLQRIRDMNSVSGIEPLQRFPKEIWYMIFENLDPVDLGNVYKVHSTFCDLLEPSVLRDILFPQILKIPQVEEFASELPRSYGPSCVQLRRVSKSMRNAYDRWIEEKLERMIRENEADEWPESGVVTLQFCDSDERESPSRLLALFKNQGAKRFFPRALCISFNLSMRNGMIDIEEVEDIDVELLFNVYKWNLFHLLELIGDQIWNFRFLFDYVYVNESSVGQAYILLQGLVKLMPNLKYLEVKIYMDHQVVEAYGLARSILEEYPFPRLSSLERVSFQPYWKTRGVFNIFETILAANEHVNMFDFHQVWSRGSDNLPTHLIQSLPLTWFRFSSNSVYGPSITIEDVQGIVNSNWPLQQIHLTLLDYTTTDIAAPMNSLLEFLEKFPTLEIVRLKEIKGICFGRSDAFCFLKLPNLKELEVRLVMPEIECEGNIDFFFSLQFLLRCEKLKTLKWCMRCVEDDELRTFLKEKEKESNGNIVNFRSGLRCLYTSNIWDVFQFLDTVKVSITKLKVCGCHARQVCEERSFICEQMYRRSDLVNGVMPVGRFLESHKCSRENTLQICAMLQS